MCHSYFILTLHFKTTQGPWNGGFPVKQVRIRKQEKLNVVPTPSIPLLKVSPIKNFRHLTNKQTNKQNWVYCLIVSLTKLSRPYCLIISDFVVWLKRTKTSDLQLLVLWSVVPTQEPLPGRGPIQECTEWKHVCPSLSLSLSFFERQKGRKNILENTKVVPLR